MKITDRFVGDHKTFRKLIRDIGDIAALPPEKRDARRIVRLVELFKDHLILHDWGEETFYYPVVRARAENAEGVGNHAYISAMDADHRGLDEMIDEVEAQVKRTPPPAGWPALFSAFANGLAAHMDKEETELFPFSERLLGADALERISVVLESRRNEAPPIRRHTA